MKCAGFWIWIEKPLTWRRHPAYWFGEHHRDSALLVFSDEFTAASKLKTEALGPFSFGSRPKSSPFPFRRLLWHEADERPSTSSAGAGTFEKVDAGGSAVAVVSANRATQVQRQGIGNSVTQTERFGTVAWPDEPIRDNVVKVNPVAQRRSKIINSFVSKGHRSRHPGFAGQTSPIPGPGYRPRSGLKRIRRKRY